MTTESGAQLHASIEGMHAFHRQCKRFLEAAEGHLLEEGWSRAAGSQALIEATYAITQPEKWMPDTLFRWFKVSEEADTYAWVSLLLSSRHPKKDAPRFDEPLASVGWVQFAEPRTETTFKHLWMARTLLWTSVPRDGTWHERRWPRKGQEIGQHGEVLVRVMGCPLAPVDSTEKLSTQLLEPLVRDIEAR